MIKNSFNHEANVEKLWELTCVSQVEQDGAWREAEVGDVGSEFKPLQKRGKILTMRSFLLSSQSGKQKSWINGLSLIKYYD